MFHHASYLASHRIPRVGVRDGCARVSGPGFDVDDIDNAGVAIFAAFDGAGAGVAVVVGADGVGAGCVGAGAGDSGDVKGVEDDAANVHIHHEPFHGKEKCRYALRASSVWSLQTLSAVHEHDHVP